VRVACGDWSRVLTPAVTTYLGDTGVFLDPPYAGEEDVYGACGSISGEVREWAIRNGNSPGLRIALCGYEGEHEMPAGWISVAWKAVGGYGNQGDGEGRINASRERIWFSPHCLTPSNGQPQSLFATDQW
jgi:DNA adenine methylase